MPQEEQRGRWEMQQPLTFVQLAQQQPGQLLIQNGWWPAWEQLDLFGYIRQAYTPTPFTDHSYGPQERRDDGVRYIRGGA